MGTYKTSTGLVGLEVDPDGKNTLIKLSDQVLESVKVFYLRCHHDGILFDGDWSHGTCRKYPNRHIIE
jgi:hypothetical protein